LHRRPDLRRDRCRFPIVVSIIVPIVVPIFVAIFVALSIFVPITVDENGDEIGSRGGALLRVDRSRRRYRKPISESRNKAMTHSSPIRIGNEPFP
jgi:hypothetical protein